MRTTNFLLILLCVIVNSFAVAQGIYAPSVGLHGTKAIYKDSTILIDWASAVTVTRGWQNISDTTLGKVTAGITTAATGKSGINGVVSLGDGGEAVLSFNLPIKNGSGADFAVFENSFSDNFLELAFVEVSSDGVNFFRFKAVSLTDTINQVSSFGSLDATNLYNLAGKYRGSYGTPFDLEELKNTVGLDVNAITHIKIIDVIGNINPTYATYDSNGKAINDPFPTAFASGGFDLDAVGVINNPVTAISTVYNVNNTIRLYPNPFRNQLFIESNSKINKTVLTDILGNKIKLNWKNSNSINTSNLPAGIYFLTIYSENTKKTLKVVKK